jgi:cytochrome c-type biogenesis protein CcmH/NrfG
MMGWTTLALLIVAAVVLLWRLGVPRDLAAFVGAALMLGAAGYALQGRPGLASASVSPVIDAREVDPAFSLLRNTMFGRFTVAESYFAVGDALTRSGSPRTAVSLYIGAINAQPRNAALWTALGSAYAEHDGTVSPAARFAFEHAMRLAPQHSGPPFFYGLALVRAGAFREGRVWWRRAYRLTPAGLSYRRDIADRLALLDQFLASEAGRSAD